MMNNKIPVALVFCLVAVSVSLAQPLVEQDVANGWQSYIVDEIEITFGGIDSHQIHCFFPIVNCVMEEEAAQRNCKIETERTTKECPKPVSKSIALKRIGENEMSFFELKFENPHVTIPASPKGTITHYKGSRYVVKFASQPHFLQSSVFIDISLKYFSKWDMFVLKKRSRLCNTCQMRERELRFLSPVLHTFVGGYRHEDPRGKHNKKAIFDAFTLNLSNARMSQVWVNPPFHLMDVVVEKLVEDKARCILICPERPKKATVPVRSGVLCGGLRLPRVRELFYPGTVGNAKHTGKAFDQILVLHCDFEMVPNKSPMVSTLSDCVLTRECELNRTSWFDDECKSQVQ
eukprot:Nk52_evm88s158 gene=Nk52_evmTU88s158